MSLVLHPQNTYLRVPSPSYLNRSSSQLLFPKPNQAQRPLIFFFSLNIEGNGYTKPRCHWQFHENHRRVPPTCAAKTRGAFSCLPFFILCIWWFLPLVFYDIYALCLWNLSDFRLFFSFFLFPRSENTVLICFLGILLILCSDLGLIMCAN